MAAVKEGVRARVARGGDARPVELAAETGASRAFVYALIRAGKLPADEIGGILIVRNAAARRFLGMELSNAA